MHVKFEADILKIREMSFAATGDPLYQLYLISDLGNKSFMFWNVSSNSDLTITSRTKPVHVEGRITRQKTVISKSNQITTYQTVVATKIETIED